MKKHSAIFLAAAMLACSAAIPVSAQTASSGIIATNIPQITRFQRNLSLGSQGEDVRSLQVILNSDPSTEVAATGPGSPGDEIPIYGSLTEKAVQAFQAKNGISATGTVGPITRALLNQIFMKNPTAPAIPVLSVDLSKAGTALVTTTFDGEGQNPTIQFVFGATIESMTMKSDVLTPKVSTGFMQIPINGLGSGDNCFVQSIVTNSVGSTKSAPALCAR